MTEFGTVEVGLELAPLTVRLTRETLVRYAGASGDFNPIHYSDHAARAIGLDGVLAHGMLTMGLAVQTIEEWVGDPGRILEYGVRFTRPVVVDPDTGADVTVRAVIGQIADDVARVDLTVTFDGATVLGKAQVRVRIV